MHYVLLGILFLLSAVITYVAFEEWIGKRRDRQAQDKEQEDALLRFMEQERREHLYKEQRTHKPKLTIVDPHALTARNAVTRTMFGYDSPPDNPGVKDKRGELP